MSGIYRKYRVNFLEHYPLGTYKVVNRCFLFAQANQPLIPAGTAFSWSSNVYDNVNTFEGGYRGVAHWHSSFLPNPNTPTWGVVEFPEPQAISGIQWEGTYLVQNGGSWRSPKRWSLEAWDEGSGQWVLLREVLDEPAWSPSEIRVYGKVSGRVVELIGQNAPCVVVFHWEAPAQFYTYNVQLNGQWDGYAPVFHGEQYGIYYLSQDNRCPPIVHGPYTAE